MVGLLFALILVRSSDRHPTNTGEGAARHEIEGGRCDRRVPERENSLASTMRKRGNLTDRVRGVSVAQGPGQRYRVRDHRQAAGR
jgi:hypothetical protein